MAIITFTVCLGKKM